jgi:hypothetical protein
MNSSDKSLTHLSVKFTFQSLFFRHKFVMNNTFRIKSAMKTVYSTNCIDTNCLVTEPDGWNALADGRVLVKRQLALPAEDEGQL